MGDLQNCSLIYPTSHLDTHLPRNAGFSPHSKSVPMGNMFSPARIDTSKKGHCSCQVFCKQQSISPPLHTLPLPRPLPLPGLSFSPLLSLHVCKCTQPFLQCSVYSDGLCKGRRGLSMQLLLCGTRTYRPYELNCL